MNKIDIRVCPTGKYTALCFLAAGLVFYCLKQREEIKSLKKEVEDTKKKVMEDDFLDG